MTLAKRVTIQKLATSLEWILTAYSPISIISIPSRLIAVLFFFACPIKCMELNDAELGEGQIEQKSAASLRAKKPIYQEAFLTSHTDGGYSYLLASFVWTGSWQWATFATEDYLSMHGTASSITSLQQFELSKEHQIYRIKCLIGYPSSFLAVKPLSKASWQWAFFASEEYLAQNPSYISHFNIHKNKNGTLRIESIGQFPGLLTIDNTGKDHAFFATEEYLDSQDKDFTTSFSLK